MTTFWASITADPVVLPALLVATADKFNVQEVLADKAYSGANNLEFVVTAKAMPYIPFRANATGRECRSVHSATWEKMFHYFSLNREQFFAHYHQRSNVESTVMMIKTKFRDHVRSKTDVAMKNEVLCKVVCHNICRLISAIFELGIDPTFPVKAPAC